MKAVIIWLGMISPMASPLISWAAILESPNEGVNLSGIGFISGWKCNATNITVTINDGEHLSVAMHQERGDLIGTCGSAPHGFIKQVNWAWPHISDGEHVIVAYDEGVEFDRVEFTVGTLGEEFPTGLEKQITVEDFPSPGEHTVLEWNESTQHFEVLSGTGGVLANEYDEAFWNEFNRTYQAGALWQVARIYAEVPNVSSCQAGRLTEAAKNRALETANQIRALHGLSPLRYIAFYDDQMQEASLIQEANPSATHTPPPSYQCYTREGREGSETSNISLSSANLDPGAHIMHLVNDANPADLPAAVGHRRWTLNPFVTNFSYGQVGRYATQKVTGFSPEYARPPQINVNFVAFPYETYPFYLLRDNTPWSFSVIVDKKNLRNNQGDFFKNATITVTRVSDEMQLPISNRYTDAIGPGLANFISWNIEGWESDTLYEVEIKNVTLNDGTTRDYSYSVFIDRPNL